MAELDPPNSMREVALSYATVRGWLVFPLHDVSSGACSCGRPDCTQGGKHPRTAHGFKDATRDPDQIAAWWATWPNANIGVATGPESGVLMIGPDGEKGREDFAGLVEQNGPVPATAKAESGSGGLHFYYRWPAGRAVKNRRDHHRLKIDVRGEGGYFVAPHSTNSNGKYTWIDDRVELADAPEWLLDWATRDEVRAVPPPVTTPAPSPRPAAYEPAEGSRWSVADRAQAYLDKCPAAVSGSLGHDALFAAARAVVYGFDLGPDVGYQLLQAHYNRRCLPPWPDRDLLRKCREADVQPFSKPRGYLLNEDREFARDTFPRLGPRLVPVLTAVNVPDRAGGDGNGGGGDDGDGERRGGGGDGDGGEPAHVDTPDNPHRVAHGFLATLPPNTLRYWRCEFFEWRHGAYVALDDDEVRARVTGWARAEFIRVNERDLADWRANGGTGKMPTVIKVTQRLVADTLNALRSITMLTSDVRPPAWVDGVTGPAPRDVIALRNGLLDTATRRLLPPTPSFFTLNALDFDYAEDAPRPVLWHRFLTDIWSDEAAPGVVDDDTIATLQEWFGYLIKADTSLQKMLFLIGPTRSGKGTTVRILGRLVGEQNLAGPTLGSLTGQFGLGPLYGKSVAVISDARLSGRADTSVIVERLLSITGEDVQTVDRKHLRQVDAKLGTRIVIASNELPKLNDASGALVNRMILIRFTKSFLGKEDPNLTDKLVAELPGILLWALDGLDRLRERGRFVQPPSSAELIQDMAELSSPISAFVRDRVVLDKTATTPIKEAFQEWKRWCEDHGRDHPGTEQSFGRELRAAVPTITCSNIRGEIGGRYRVYRGIRLRTALDDADQPGDAAWAAAGHTGEAGLVDSFEL